MPTPPAPVQRVPVPPTVPPKQNPITPRPGLAPAPVTAPNLEKESPAPPGLPATLPPTVHPSIPRPGRFPALKTPPGDSPFPPPSTPPSGEDESPSAQLGPIGEFDSSSEHPVLPSPHEYTIVKVTLLPKRARSRVVVPSPEGL